MGLGAVLGGPAGKFFLGAAKAIGKFLFNTFLTKPKSALKALNAGLNIKKRADVAKAKLARKPPEELQAEKLRKRADKKAESEIVTAMDMAKLTSEAKRLNNIKTRNTSLGKERFVNAMSSINKPSINTNRLKVTASSLESTTVPFNEIPSNQVSNTILPSNTSALSNSISSLNSMAIQSPEAKPIAELGQILTQQNIIMSQSNTENSRRIGEMIKTSAEIDIVNAKTILASNNAQVKLVQSQNKVISETAAVVAGVQDTLPNELNATAAGIVNATADLVQSATDFDKDAIISVGDDVNDKLTNLGTSIASANALIIRNDNQGTDQILEAVNDGNLMIESKVNALMTDSRESNHRKWGDLVKIGKEVVREWLKETLVSIFEIFEVLKLFFFDTPLMRKLSAYLNVGYDAAAGDAVEFNQLEYDKLVQQRNQLVESGATKAEVAKIDQQMSMMKARGAKHKSVTFRKTVSKVTENNFMDELENLRQSEWWNNHFTMMNDIMTANTNPTMNQVQGAVNRVLNILDHRYQAMTYINTANTSTGANKVYENYDLSAQYNGERKNVLFDTYKVDSALYAPLVDKPSANSNWLWSSTTWRSINFMILHYAEVGSSYNDYYSIPLDDFFFASYDYAIRQANIFDNTVVKHLGRSFYNYTVSDLTPEKVVLVLAYVKTRNITEGDYIDYLKSRSPKDVCDILDAGLNKYGELSTDAKGVKLLQASKYTITDAKNMKLYELVDLINGNNPNWDGDIAQMAVAAKSSVSTDQFKHELNNTDKFGYSNSSFEDTVGIYKLLEQLKIQYPSHKSEIDDSFVITKTDEGRFVLNYTNGDNKPSFMNTEDWNGIRKFLNFTSEEDLMKEPNNIVSLNKGGTSTEAAVKLTEAFNQVQAIESVVNELTDVDTIINEVSRLSENSRAVMNSPKTAEDKFNEINDILEDLNDQLTEISKLMSGGKAIKNTNKETGGVTNVDASQTTVIVSNNEDTDAKPNM